MTASTKGMKKLDIAILFGGASTEFEISCVSAASVLDNIDTDKFNIYKLGILKDGKWFIYNGENRKIRDLSWITDTQNQVPAILSPCSAHHGMMVLNKAEKKYEIIHLDCVFPVLHGANGEDGTMQGLLKLSGIPYVGSETRAAAVTMDKATTKIILDKQGIKQAEWVSLMICDFKNDKNGCLDDIERHISYPMFVKPSNAGSSVGISKVSSREALSAAIEKAGEVDTKIIIEENICGRELEIALLEDYSDGKKLLIASGCGEIVPDREFYDYDAKYKTNGTVIYIPAEISDEKQEEMKTVAKRIFTSLECRGLSRADFFLTKNGEIVFNEINAIPGFTGISMFPKLMEYIGIPYKRLITILIEGAMR